MPVFSTVKPQEQTSACPFQSLRRGRTESHIYLFLTTPGTWQWAGDGSMLRPPGARGASAHEWSWTGGGEKWG